MACPERHGRNPLWWYTPPCSAKLRRGATQVMVVGIHLVWAEFELVSGEAVAQAQRHGGQVVARQATAER